MKGTFATREFDGKTGAMLTKEEFIAMAIADVETAKESYMKAAEEDAEATYKRDLESFADRRAQKIQEIIDTSYKKYKREFYRLRWVEQEIAKVPTEMSKNYYHTARPLKSLLWDVKPWENGSSYIDLDRDLTYVFGYLYDEAIKNKYFQQCTGWSIIGDIHTEFKFHLSEELQNEWKADEKKLSDAITRFYSGSNYWGD